MSVATARRLRRKLTDAELRLWRALQALDLPHTHFIRQAPIGPYVADFVCHAAKLIVEVDGGQHNEPRGIEYDTERTEFLQSRGYKVLRFWNPDVLRDVGAVVATILHELDARAGTPHPARAKPSPTSPQGGG